MAVAGAVKISLEGEREVLRALGALPDRVQRRGLRSAVSKAARPIVRAAKGYAPARSRKRDEQGRIEGPTGLLKKSISHVLRTYPRTGTVVAIIGPKKGMKTIIDGKPRDPVNYAHLVEFGHRIAVGGELERLDGRKSRGRAKTNQKPTGRHVGNVPGRPFLTPAYKENEARSLAVLRQGLAEGIEREAAKLAAKGGK